MGAPTSDPRAAPPRENTSRGTHAVVAELVTGLLAGRAGARLLDVPCGEGAFLARMARMARAGLELHGADLVAPTGALAGAFHRADMNAPLPFEDERFDAIACIDGIEHLQRPFDFARECARVLKPGGGLVVSTPNVSSLRSRWRFLLTGFHNKAKTPLDETRPSPLHHVHMLPYPDLRYTLHTAGLEVSEVRTNRVKGVSWLYAPLVPLARAATGRVFQREEERPDQRRRNREILRTLFSRPVLFGETLVALARKR